MQIDLLEDTWEREVPHEQFAYLRREAPVHWHDVPDDTGFWAVTRYHDVRAVSRDHQTWSTEAGSTFIRTQAPEALDVMRLMLLNMDPPRQSRYRKLVSAGFTPRMIRKLTETITARAARIADTVADKGGEVEFVTDVAQHLPLQMICDMVGVPEADQAMIFDWSNRMVGFQDSDFRTTPEDGEIAAAEMYAYCDALVEERRTGPRDDILTALINAEIDGDRLSRDEIDAFFVLLSVAGNETTRNLIAHAMRALIERPDVYRELVDRIGDEDLWRSATEEFLRWGSSIHNFRRTALRDTELHGQKIAEGEKVVTFYASANYDEEIFTDPLTLDIRRSPNDHVTFGGGGPHFCLGAGLARAQITAMLRELLRRFPAAEFTAPPKRMRSDFINGIKHMPVRFRR
ncbi:cytochrome P450 [Planobispora rosea]|uniref:Cytochrome P450 n=1 Tax=Planobispora rosea TaxID=35762 RepID=A0A8J3S1G3_PLARO|nr:cytochrome P450 [Planobispora rosea]GGS72603.1 cytochrome P450 [Planobispora rosea]GIH85298.1 cytochrome P450 [Planobispora rosea]